MDCLQLVFAGATMLQAIPLGISNRLPAQNEFCASFVVRLRFQEPHFADNYQEPRPVIRWTL